MKECIREGMNVCVRGYIGKRYERVYERVRVGEDA